MVSGRKPNGQFDTGHKFSVGNHGGRKKRPVEEKFLSLLQENITPEDFAKLIQVGLARGKSGDRGWAQLLLSYLIGLPTQRIEHSGPEGGPVELSMTWGDDRTESDPATAA